MAKPKPKRKSVKRSARNWPRIRRNLTRAAFLCVVLGGVYWFFAADMPYRIQQGLLEATADGGLAVEHILVEGRSRTSASALRAALRIEEGDPLLQFDPHEARARLLTLPWVSEARIERLAPATIHVTLVEHTPIALWQFEQKLYLLNSMGKLIGEKPQGEFDTLLLVVGHGAPTRVVALQHMMSKNPSAKARVTSAVWVGDRRWNLWLDKRVEVRLPEDNVETAWRHLVRLLNTHDLEKEQITRIDLRLPDRIIMKNAEAFKEIAP